MYRANLSFLQLKDYLNYLIEKKLLEVQKIGGNVLYKTTKGGLTFLQNYRQLRDQLLIPGTERRTPK
jgi:predicted transcriptional regulator